MVGRVGVVWLLGCEGCVVAWLLGSCGCLVVLMWLFGCFWYVLGELWLLGCVRSCGCRLFGCVFGWLFG